VFALGSRAILKKTPNEKSSLAHKMRTLEMVTWSIDEQIAHLNSRGHIKIPQQMIELDTTTVSLLSLLDDGSSAVSFDGRLWIRPSSPCLSRLRCRSVSKKSPMAPPRKRRAEVEEGFL
jgi:hypothetical protein